MLETYEPLEGSSGPLSPSSPRVRGGGRSACGGIPGARWLSNSFREKRSGSFRVRANGHRGSRKRGWDQVVVEVAQLERDSSMGSDMESDRGVPAYAGWVYHVGTSSLGYPFCSDRFLVIKGKYVSMFKRNPVEYPRAMPIRSGIVGTHLMVEEVGRQIFNGRALYVLRIFNRLDHSRQGEFACNTAEEVDKWVSAFKHAKDEAEFSSGRIGSGRRIINPDDEFDINGPRTHSRSVTRGIGKLITIGKGPGSLLKRPSMVLPQEPDSDGYYNYREGDTFEQADWRCFCTVNGLRIFEDITASKAEKGTIMKAVGVIEATPETIFEHIMSLDSTLRHQWDTLTGNLELIEQIDGHSDIVYGTFDPKYFKRFHSKRDFLFSRYWRRDQDGSYSITQVSTTHKSRPAKPCFQRIDLSPGIWEITPLPSRPGSETPRALVTQVVEVKSTGWGRWKRSHYSKFHKTIPYILLCRIAGLRELLGASPELSTVEAHARRRLNKEVKKALETADPVLEVAAPILMKSPKESATLESHEEFYDAIMADDSDEEEDECDENEMVDKHETAGQNFNGLSWGAKLGLSTKAFPATRGGRELDWNAPSLELDPNKFYSSLRRTISDQDCNGWSDPGGKGFMVRSQTYNENSLKISGGEPLLKLLAVDWLKSDQRIDHIALQSSSCVQSPAGKKAPFILVINLQVPAKPCYSLVMYFVADKPIQPGSLLDHFANGDDAFRNSRFKLIPSIVEGYWMVKRAVGTKACLLGKAVTCNYLRKDNFLEIDVDIGSSSVARNVVGFVLGYVTSVVVDLAILIEAKSAHELPEYLLGTMRINRIKVESAIQFDGNALN
ncbi:hypothetical protein M758_1G199400 [Ceratodon purpureus]|nr:hypothetical protein M758_1G199400 [Ceratodon purpureus]